MLSLSLLGLWLELEVVYTGSLQMTLETKMDLCKLGRESVCEADCIPETRHLRYMVCAGLCAVTGLRTQ